MPMTRKRALLVFCLVAILGNLAMALLAYSDLRRMCPDGAQCADAWTSLVLFCAMGSAFVVATGMVWRGRIG